MRQFIQCKGTPTDAAANDLVAHDRLSSIVFSASCSTLLEQTTTLLNLLPDFDMGDNEPFQAYRSSRAPRSQGVEAR